MQAVHIYLRKTFSYAAGWSNLDREDYMGTLKITPNKLVAEPGPNADHSEGPTYVQYARAPAGVPLRLVKQAVRDTFGGTSCRHEHDCCGCVSRAVRVTNVGRKLKITTRVSYNY